MTSKPRESGTFYSSMWGLDLKELTSSKVFLALEQDQRRENLMVKFERTWSKSFLLGASYDDFPCNPQCVEFQWILETFQILSICVYR